jgi:NAD(P)-dependent dehydrogenase (short-subunit alcohol dehydrogenase family)
MSQTIVITGVSRGLGRAMTEEFVRRGHTVFGCARNGDAVAQLQQKFGEPHDFTRVDVADEAQVEAWRDRILAKSEPPDLLINNAGVINEPNSLWEVDRAEFDRVIDVNIKGVANVIRQFVPATIQRQRGIIVNFSSGWGRSASGNVAPYCATKWAIEGMTRSLAQELPSGMAAIPLNPGIIHTDMLDICFGSQASSFESAQSWGRKAVSFLLKLKPRDNGSPLTIS